MFIFDLQRFANIKTVAEGQVVEGLPTANNSVKGGVKIGTGVSVNSEGTISIPVVTATNNGLMSATDKTKLNGITSGAQPNLIEVIKVNGNSLSINNKTVDITVPDISGKVDKVSGKQLSTNDFTDAYKNKIDSLSSSTGDINIIEAVQVNGTALPVTNKTVNIDISGKVDTVAGKGLSTNDFTTGEKTKLAAIDSGAQVNVIETVKVDGSALSVNNKSVNIVLSGKVDTVAGKGLSTNDYTTAEKTKLAGIDSGAQANVIETVKVNGNPLVPSLKAVDITVPDISGKVDKVTGKQLSTNDYTTSDLNKLTAIEDNAQVNKIEKVKVNGTALTISSSDKSVNIDISGKVDKVNGKQLSTEDYTTAEKRKLAALSDNGEENVIEVVKVNGTALTVDSSDKSVNVDISNKVDKVSGKQLSTEDYTTAEKNKLAGIDNNANNYTLPVAKAATIGGVKVDAVTKSNISLGSDGNISVPAASASQAGVIKLNGSSSQYLKGDGTWGTPPNDNTTYTVGTGLSQNGTVISANSNYLGSIQKGSGTTTYLRNDGTWGTPPDTHYTAKIIAGTQNDTVNAATGNTSTYINLIENNAITGRVKLVGAGSVNVSSAGNGLVTITGQNTTYDTVTSSANGLMSSGDKTKLDGIASGAQVNVIEKVSINGAAITPSNKGVNIDISGKVDTISGKGLSTNDYTTTEKTKLAGIVSGATKNSAGTNVSIDSDGVISVATGSAQKAGVLQVGANLAVSNGIVSLQSAGVTGALGYTPAADTAFSGATSNAAGTKGLVPVPAAGKQNAYLRGDGTWETPAGATYDVVTSSANGLMSSTDKAKLDSVTAQAFKDVAVSGQTVTFTKGNGATATIQTKDTTYTTVTSSNPGLVPKLTGESTKFLNASGSWGTPANTFYPSNLKVGTKGSTVNTTTANDTTYLNIIENNASVSAVNLKGAGSVTVTSSGAADIVIAGTNTTYSTVTASQNGLMSSGDKAKLDSVTAGAIKDVTVSGQKLTFTKGDGTTVTLNTQDTNTDTHYTTKAIVGAATGTVNAATTNGNTNLRIFDNNTARATFNIKGTGAAAVTSDSLGNIIINSTDTNTTYTAGTGLSLSGTTFSANSNYLGSIQKGTGTTTYLRNDGTWATPPGTVTNTDAKVAQNVSTVNSDYPVLIAATANATANIAATNVAFGKGVKINPNTSKVTATTFDGLATKATGDKNGNDITTTYLTTTNAASTYLTQTDAASTYLGKTAKAASATTADSATTATTAGSLTAERSVSVSLGSTTVGKFRGHANVTLGVQGTLPVGSGGTGLTASPSMLTNLGSTTAADILTASPRPGVTGTLPVANGGTGQTVLSAVTVGKANSLTTARNIVASLAATAAGSFNGTAAVTVGTQGILPIAKGGTNASTAANARTQLGLGAVATQNTVAIANGGTAMTTNPSMLVNLGTTAAANVFAASPRPGVTGTLPVANGGTGATSVADIKAGKDADGSVISSTYAKLSGAAFTGNISLGTAAAPRIIALPAAAGTGISVSGSTVFSGMKVVGINSSTPTVGADILVQGGNKLILSAGELGQNTYNNTTLASSIAPNTTVEGMYLLSDQGVTVRTNGNVPANAKEFVFGTGGILTAMQFTGNLSGNVSGSVSGNAGGNAKTASSLQTAVGLQVSLNKTSATNFQGNAAVNNIGVQGTLQPAQGGTGQTVLSAVSVGTAAMVERTVPSIAGGSPDIPSLGSDLVWAKMATNDCFRIRVGGGSNNGWAEIATGDDNNEPIFVRQYKGGFGATDTPAVTNEVTLLDTAGMTRIKNAVLGGTRNETINRGTIWVSHDAHLKFANTHTYIKGYCAQFESDGTPRWSWGNGSDLLVQCSQILVLTGGECVDRVYGKTLANYRAELESVESEETTWDGTDIKWNLDTVSSFIDPGSHEGIHILSDHNVRISTNMDRSYTWTDFNDNKRINPLHFTFTDEGNFTAHRIFCGDMIAYRRLSLYTTTNILGYGTGSLSGASITGLMFKRGTDYWSGLFGGKNDMLCLQGPRSLVLATGQAGLKAVKYNGTASSIAATNLDSVADIHLLSSKSVRIKCNAEVATTAGDYTFGASGIFYTPQISVGGSETVNGTATFNGLMNCYDRLYVQYTPSVTGDASSSLSAENWKGIKFFSSPNTFSGLSAFDSGNYVVLEGSDCLIVAAGECGLFTARRENTESSVLAASHTSEHLHLMSDNNVYVYSNMQEQTPEVRKLFTFGKSGNFFVNNGGISVTGSASIAGTASIASNLTVSGTAKLASLTGAGVHSLSAIGDIGWGTTANQHKVLDMSAIAYWNGRYSSTASNLAYCNKGAFGTMATVNSPVPIADTVNSTADVVSRGFLP